MKYSNCSFSISPSFCKLNISPFYIYVQKVSLGDTIISYTKIFRWKFVLVDGRQLYLIYITPDKVTWKKHRIYVITTDKDNNHYILEQPRDNNMANLKGLL